MNPSDDAITIAAATLAAALFRTKSPSSVSTEGGQDTLLSYHQEFARRLREDGDAGPVEPITAPRRIRIKPGL
ncbi:hypothetical protein ACBY01_14370 [Sphingomonas sp. ac-8]|uniref:hypothetical protein n=1 Tax=Sphingomonas sp. ac-8 TaxID=3242977 RepID=UPI003A8110BA